MSKINATTTGIQNIGDTTPDIEFQSGGITKVVMKDDGRFYGTALHNNAGAVTGAANQYIASGTYTPTLYNTTNVTSSTSLQCQWIRVGNVVTVSGAFNVVATTTLLNTVLGMSLPIASAFSVIFMLGGTASGIEATPTPWAVYGDISNDRANFDVTNRATTADTSVMFSFTYLVT